MEICAGRCWFFQLWLTVESVLYVCVCVWSCVYVICHSIASGMRLFLRQTTVHRWSHRLSFPFPTHWPHFLQEIHQHSCWDLFPSESLPLCFVLSSLTDFSISDFQEEDWFDFYAVIFTLNVNNFLSYMGLLEFYMVCVSECQVIDQSMARDENSGKRQEM